MVAVTVKVYAVPLIRPFGPQTVIGLVDPMAVRLQGLDVTLYEVIGLP